MKEKVEKLINDFSQDNLVALFRNKTRSFTYKVEEMECCYKENFTNCRLLGSFETPDDNLELLVFTAKTNNELSERSGKKRQYELGKRLLKEQFRYSGGFFIFYDSNGSFRFSFIHDIPLPNGKLSYSNYKRYTYFVSRDQTNKTFIQQITDADFSSLPKIIEAFSVDRVRAEFYHEIACWYFWAIDKVKFPDDYKYSTDPAKDTEIRNSTNLIRLLTRVIFIWFLNEKKLIPKSLFDTKVLKSIVKDFYKGKNSSNYYNAILQNLFFGTLNQKMNERTFVNEKDFAQNRKEYGVKNLYRYADKFAISKQEAVTLFDDIPFLNGGLFDCLDKEDETGKVIYIDGFSRNPSKQAKIYDYLFFQAEEECVNLSDYEMGKNKTVRGLFEILKSYNFTIDESTSIDQEVALDPEMLGKVFEELLASYNPETSSTARKATGSFYTPREIVDYMVQQSIKYYLTSHTQLDENAIEKLLTFTDKVPPLSEAQKKQIIESLDSIKILDPACGSGAFPMGILHQLVFILQKLDPDNKIWYEVQYNKALEATQKAFKHSDKNERAERLKEINESFDENINYPDYARKLYLIENSIYGVDIQPIAIQISKLRFFISLVLDQKIDRHKENYGIRPLPNLETKFVAANTLIGLDKPQQTKLRNPDIEVKENQRKQLRHQYFTANTRKKKLALQKQDKKLRLEISKMLEKDGWDTKVAKQIATFDPYDQNSFANWFDTEWMFGLVPQPGDTGVFDIVIGNPPYIQLQKTFNGKLKYADFYNAQHYNTFDRTGDIYCLFYEKGLQLLKHHGHLCYITSNKWMRAGYGEKLREFFIQYNPLQLIDLGPGVFENATVDTNILIIQKSKSTSSIPAGGSSFQNKEDLGTFRSFQSKDALGTLRLRAVTLQKEDKTNIAIALKEKGVVLTKLTKDAWFIGSDAEQRLKEKIERIGKPLKEWDVNIYYGIKTGLNEAFIITTEKRNEILAGCSVANASCIGGLNERQRTEAIIKPILRGRDIKRYCYEWAGLWVIFIPWHFPLHEDLSIQGASQKAEKEFQKQYPSVYNHLFQFKDALQERNKEETGIRYEWYALQRCAATYYPEFEKEKVVYGQFRKGEFAYDEQKMFLSSNEYMIVGKYLKYILALINSKTAYKYQTFISNNLSGQTTIAQKDIFINLPLPPITPSNEPIVKQIEALVDKILEVKQSTSSIPAGESRSKNASDTLELEKEIDALVYRLYDLTEEEIRIIEKKP